MVSDGCVREERRANESPLLSLITWLPVLLPFQSGTRGTNVYDRNYQGLSAVVFGSSAHARLAQAHSDRN